MKNIRICFCIFISFVGFAVANVAYAKKVSHRKNTTQNASDGMQVKLTPKKRRKAPPPLEVKEAPPRQDRSATTIPSDYYKTSLDPRDDKKIPVAEVVETIPPSTIKMKDITRNPPTPSTALDRKHPLALPADSIPSDLKTNFEDKTVVAAEAEDEVEESAPQPTKLPVQEVKSTPPTDLSTPAFVPPQNIPVEKALALIRNGNFRFQKNKMRHESYSKKDRLKWLKDPKPHTSILSCSDARMAPETIFDQRPGELFVVRNMGPRIDDSVISSFEYAYRTLGTRLLVVVLNDYCGAPVSPTANYAKILIAELRNRSRVLDDAMASNSLTAQVAIYDIRSGAATFLK